MQQQLTDIKSNLHTRIQQSVDSLLPENNKVLYGGKSEKSSSGFLTEINDETDIFARYKKRFNVDLTETWSDRPWWRYDSENKCRIFYPGHLKLNWTGYGVKWECESGLHNAALSPISSEENTVNAGVSPSVLGGTDWGSNMKSVSLLPFKIDKSFFGKEGSIVVAAKAPIPDLFGNVFGKNKFLNFRVDGNLWAVAAARAGYRNGEKYENSKFLNEDQWNLFEDDWEPMFLPVGRCWKSWDGEKFTGDDAYKVLEAVAENLDIDISENGLNLNEKVNLDVLH